MAITKNIVDMMGGTIKVQTAQGKGTEFIICLPMRTQAEHRPVEKITEPEGLKALVVEDNELNREIAPEILREYGFRVDTAENQTRKRAMPASTPPSPSFMQGCVCPRFCCTMLEVHHEETLWNPCVGRLGRRAVSVCIALRRERRGGRIPSKPLRRTPTF